MRKLVVLEDVVLKSAFPELLPAGASDGPPLDWWPTQTNKHGDGGALGPHASEEASRLSDDEERLLTKRSMANTSLGKNTCLGVERIKKQNFHDPDTDLMETNLSLTFQGDFCVSMVGRGALRCKNAEPRDVLEEQLKRSEAPRSGTRNGPREEEHTSTANTSGEGAHFNSEYGTAKSGIKLSRTHRTDARKTPVTAPRYPNRNNTDNMELQIENPQENAQIVACVLRAPRNDLQRGRVRSAAAQRSSPAQQPGARPEVLTENNEETVQLSCVLPDWCDARTYDDRYAAAPAQRLDDEVEGAEELGPGSAFRGEQPLSHRRAACPGSGEGVVIASWL